MKNKLTILLVFLGLFSLNLKAQQASVLFQVEEENYLNIHNLMPNAILEEYSTIHGGAMLGTITLNEKGAVQAKYKPNNTPAFLLNRITPKNKVGDNKVYFTPSLEFKAENIRLDHIADRVIVSWDAQVYIQTPIQFQVIAKKGTDEKVLKTINATTSTALLGYGYEAPFEEGTSYSIRILASNDAFRYETKALLSEGGKEILVYPTVSAQDLFVRLQEGDFARYTIVNMQGSVVKKGIMRALNNKLNIASLNAGQYIISIQDKDDAYQSFKLLKVDY